jgi:hypothetical protein
LLAATLASSLFSVSAHARARVFVASYGNDANPCTFLSPCKTFQQAVNVVDAGGEVTAIDSAGFGPLNINKAVTITSPPGIEASIAAAAGGSAVAVAAGATDVVTLRGLTLNGGGSGGYGITFTAGAKLAVIDCVISNYTQYRILVKNSSATNMLVLVTNTVVTETVGGIELATFGTGSILGSFGGLTLDNNTNSIQFVADGGQVNAVIVNSQIWSNTQIGVYSRAKIGTLNDVFLTNVTFGEMPYDVYLDGNTIVYISHVAQLEFGTTGIYCTDTTNSVASDSTSFLLPVPFGALCNVLDHPPK